MCLEWYQDEPHPTEVADLERERAERELPRCIGCGLPIAQSEDGWCSDDRGYSCIDGFPHEPDWAKD